MILDQLTTYRKPHDTDFEIPSKTMEDHWYSTMDYHLSAKNYLKLYLKGSSNKPDDFYMAGN